METSPRYISQRRRLFASVLLRLLAAAAMYLSAVLLSFLLLLFSVLIAVQGTGRGTVALDSLTFDKVIASFTKLSFEIWFVIQIITSDSEILLLSLLSFLCSLSFLLCFLLIWTSHIFIFTKHISAQIFSFDKSTVHYLLAFDFPDQWISNDLITRYVKSKIHIVLLLSLFLTLIFVIVLFSYATGGW